MEKIQLNRFTWEDKAALLSGQNAWETHRIQRLNINSAWMSDGPHGLRKEVIIQGQKTVSTVPSTCFPCAVTLGNSFDDELLFEVGEAIGKEAGLNAVSLVLGPGVNIKRNPLCGRNFEYYSEDPLVAGRSGAAFIKGVQSTSVGACLKHFACNNQEKNRLTVNSVVDERALHELYLKPFEWAVKNAHPEAVMSSYNKVNGEYAAENKYLLSEVLRDQWGFEGLIISDWGGTNNRVKGLKAGLDLEMPSSGGINSRKILKALQAGVLSEEEVDTSVERVLHFSQKKRNTTAVDFARHHNLASRALEESAVLMKNEHHLLPLSKNMAWCVIGDFAQEPKIQGSGSSCVNPIFTDSFINSLKTNGQNFEFAQGFESASNKTNQVLLKEAIELATKSSHVILFVGLNDEYEIEGIDRTHLLLPTNQRELIDEITHVNNRVIVVLSAGSVIDMSWAENCNSILNVFLPGQASGPAIERIVNGSVNPSGHLNETIPSSYSDVPSAAFYDSEFNQALYKESLYVGYRYYDTLNTGVKYPFGYGLSYTDFEIIDVQTETSKLKKETSLSLKIDVQNTGEIDGKAVVQLYVRPSHSALYRPIHELKTYKKISINSKEVTSLDFSLKYSDFAYYHPGLVRFCVEEGDYAIEIGFNSRDIKRTVIVHVAGETNLPLMKDDAYRFPIAFTDEDFTLIYGKELKKDSKPTKGSFDMNSSLASLAQVVPGKILLRVAQVMVDKQIKFAKSAKLNRKIAAVIASELPLRSVVMMGKGIVSEANADRILRLCNGKGSTLHE